MPSKLSPSELVRATIEAFTSLMVSLGVPPRPFETATPAIRNHLPGSIRNRNQCHSKPETGFGELGPKWRQEKILNRETLVV